MYDRDTAMLDQYELTVENIKKVRGGWLCIAKEGLFVWRESKSGEERLELEEKICRKSQELGLSRVWNCAGGSQGLRMEQLICNREGRLLTKDDYGRAFVLKKWTEGRECDVRNHEDLCKGALAAACMHQTLRLVWKELQKAETEREVWEEIKTETNETDETSGRVIGRTDEEKFRERVFREEAGKPDREDGGDGTEISRKQARLTKQESYEKLWNRRKRELLRVQHYVRKRRNKNLFEQILMKETPYYAAQAEMALELQGQIVSERLEKQICHGDFHYHNLIYGTRENWICQSSRLHLGYQIADFYLYLRKCMEKHDWDWMLARELMLLYQSSCPVSPWEWQLLYCLFLFPEKYWKQVNFYAQSNKAWMPEKNVVKLRSLVNQEHKRQDFLKNLHEFSIS